MKSHSIISADIISLSSSGTNSEQQHGAMHSNVNWLEVLPAMCRQSTLSSRTSLAHLTQMTGAVMHLHRETTQIHSLFVARNFVLSVNVITCSNWTTWSEPHMMFWLHCHCCCWLTCRVPSTLRVIHSRVGAWAEQSHFGNEQHSILSYCTVEIIHRNAASTDIRWLDSINLHSLNERVARNGWHNTTTCGLLFVRCKTKLNYPWCHTRPSEWDAFLRANAIVCLWITCAMSYTGKRKR